MTPSGSRAWGKRQTARRTRFATRFFVARFFAADLARGCSTGPLARVLSALAASSMRVAISSDSLAAGRLMRNTV